MMLDIMNRYRDRFVSHDESLLKELDFSEQFMSRIEKIRVLQSVKKIWQYEKSSQKWLLLL